MIHFIKDFEDYLDRANRCETPDELFNVYLEAIGRHGIDRAMFGLLTDHEEIGEKAGIGICRNYPEDWMAYYYANEIDKNDPIAQYALTTADAFTWDEALQHIKLTPLQQEAVMLCAEAGLHNGLAVSLRSAGNQIAGIGLATSEKKDSFDGRIDLITAYSNHFYTRFRQMKKMTQPKINFNLTGREREILTWVAQGKSNSDIAGILSLSIHTIDFHMRNAFVKLDAPSRTVAVVKAISYGLIAP